MRGVSGKHLPVPGEERAAEGLSFPETSRDVRKGDIRTETWRETSGQMAAIRFQSGALLDGVFCTLPGG